MKKINFVSSISAGFLFIWTSSSEKPAFNLVNISKSDPRIAIELKYATNDNFLNEVIYTSTNAYLLSTTMEKLSAVEDHLITKGYSLKVFDGFRPLSAQYKMWNRMPDPDYVADPSTGSNHNRGCAVDVTLLNMDGSDLPMPTQFDEFSVKAHHSCTDLPTEILKRRELLKNTMEAYGFNALETEWWHYSDISCHQFPLLEISLSELDNLNK